MKRRVILLLAMLSVASLAGCELPFGNKDEGSTPSGDSSIVAPEQNQETTVVQFSTTVGTTLTPEEVAAPDATKVVTASMFVLPTGAMDTSFTPDVEGTQTIDIMYQYDDGSTQTVSVALTVEPGQVMQMPASIANWIASGDYDSIGDLRIHNMTSKEDIAFLVNMDHNSNIEFENGLKVSIGLSTVTDEFKDTMISDLIAMIQSMSEMAPDGEEKDSFTLEFNVLKRIIDNFAEVDTGVAIYDVDGEAHPIKASVGTIKLSEITGNAADDITVTSCYYVDLGKNGVHSNYIIGTPVEMVVEDMPSNEESSEDAPLFKTEEEVIAALKAEYDKDPEGYLATITNGMTDATLSQENLQYLANNLTYGEIQSTDNTPAAPPEETPANPNDTTDFNTSQGTQDDNTNISVTAKGQSYADKHAKFYSFKETDQNIYKRFLYNVVGHDSSNRVVQWKGGYYPNGDIGYYSSINLNVDGGNDSSGSTGESSSESSTKYQTVTMKVGDESITISESKDTYFKSTTSKTPTLVINEGTTISQVVVSYYTDSEFELFLSSGYTIGDTKYELEKIKSGSTEYNDKYDEYGFKNGEAEVTICAAMKLKSGYLVFTPTYKTADLSSTSSEYTVFKNIVKYDTKKE